MNKELLSDIAAYFKYLRSLGLSVSFHKKRYSALAPYVKYLLDYNFHGCDYCMLIKSEQRLWDKCVKSQLANVGAAEPGKIYMNICYAGVCEYVFPIGTDEVVGYVSVSDFRNGDRTDISVISEIAEKYGISEEKLHFAYRKLSTSVPDIDEIKPIIMPLCHMLYLLSSEPPDDLTAVANDRRDLRRNDDEMCSLIVSFIVQNIKERITIKDISGYCHYSPSHISHIFKKHTGRSVLEFVNDTRLNMSAELLSSTELPINKISERVGFSDSNYFSNAFHKRYGLSPREYRANSRESKPLFNGIV